MPCLREHELGFDFKILQNGLGGEIVFRKFLLVEDVGEGESGDIVFGGKLLPGVLICILGDGIEGDFRAAAIAAAGFAKGHQQVAVSVAPPCGNLVGDI